MKFRKDMSASSGGNRPATMAAQAPKEVVELQGHNPRLLSAQPRVGAAESVVRTSDSAAARESIPALSADDEVDLALEELGVHRQEDPPWDPRGAMTHAVSMTNGELGELLVRLSTEHDRVGRLAAKQDFVVGQVRHARRDREVDVRSAPPSSCLKLDDIVWADPIYRKLNEVLLLQERVLRELQADVVALNRHYAAISRLIEVRRQEQERELIAINVPNRRATFGRKQQ